MKEEMKIEKFSMEDFCNYWTIERMLTGNEIVVPNYQRAYSWEVDKKSQKNKQVNIFLKDILEFYNKSKESKQDNETKFYLGNFLYEKMMESFI